MSGISVREFAEDLGRAADNFDNPGEGFDCRKCGVRFVPRPGQWIFYNLCDACFEAFDEQKMEGRFAFLTGNIGEHVESSTTWIESTREDRA